MPRRTGQEDVLKPQIFFVFTHARTMLSVLSVSALAGMARLVVGQISENIVLSEFDAARVGTG